MRGNSKKYGSFATNINHHQPEAQAKCILFCDKHDLDNCEEYMKKEANSLLGINYVMVVINKFQCHAMQELAMTDESGADLGYVISVALTDIFPKKKLYKQVLKTWKTLLVADN